VPSISMYIRPKERGNILHCIMIYSILLYETHFHGLLDISSSPACLVGRKCQLICFTIHCLVLYLF
jgi:hypothetical protein